MSMLEPRPQWKDDADVRKRLEMQSDSLLAALVKSHPDHPHAENARHYLHKRIEQELRSTAA